MQTWDPQFAARSPLFNPLHVARQFATLGAWPAPDALTAIATALNVRSGDSRSLRFVQAGVAATTAADYELRISDTGEVPLRDANWHDFFNALVWLSFPRLKSALNHAHAQELNACRTGTRNLRRSAQRDALTLFDESGILVLSSSAQILQGIRDFSWRQVFVEQREMLKRTTRFLIFGHAVYEKALSPYIGMTGHALLLQTDKDAGGEQQADVAQRTAQADAMGASRVKAGLLNTRELSPLPLLGVPGWWAANTEPSFYDNTDYFRAGRARRQA